MTTPSKEVVEKIEALSPQEIVMLNECVNFQSTQFAKSLHVVLTKRREELIKGITSFSVSPDRTELSVKVLGGQLQQLNSVIELIYEPDKFVEKYFA